MSELLPIRAFSEGILSNLHQLPDKIFLAGNDGHITFDQFFLRVSKAISAIQNIIPTRQNIVFLDTDNTVSFVIALFALNHLAQIAVPISSTSSPGERRKLYEAYQPVLIIRNVEMHTPWALKTSLLRFSDLDNFPSISDIPEINHNEDDICFILFTSGSEGLPKGVMLTNRNIISDIIGIQDYMMLSGKDKCLITRSLSHASALVAELLLTSLTQGSCILKGRPTTIRSLFDHCESENVTWLGVPPVLLRRIVDYGKLQGRQFSPKTVVVSGSILSRRLCLDFIETFPSIKLINAYGLTEASPRVAYLDASLSSIKPGAVGYPIKGCKLHVLNGNGTKCQPSEVGEVHVTGENIMKGYFFPDDIKQNTSGNFLRTGDSGFLDEDGALFIVGRKDNMVTYNGLNVYPEYINSIVEQSEVVQQAHTMLISSETFVDKLITFVEITQKVSLDKALSIIRDHLEMNLDMRLNPNYIVIIETFPLTVSGKIDLKKLEQDYLRALNHNL